MNLNADNSSTLVILCRRPSPGVGKQRIAARLGAGATASLAERLLATALEDAETWPGPVVIAPARPDDAGWAGACVNRNCRVVPQPDGNLGERINAVDRIVRRDGDARLIFVGTDAPTLDAPYFAAARRALESDDIVLGPAEDGGVTLMGAARAWPPLDGLPWSTSRLAAALKACCLDHGLSVRLLEPRRDIDEVGDLPRLQADLANDPRDARRALYYWLEQNGTSPGQR